MKETNPCMFEHGKCSTMRKGDIVSCCVKCEHLSKTGCTVKALSCKLWLCSALDSVENKLTLRLKILKIIQWKNKLDGFRMSKEQIFEKFK